MEMFVWLIVFAILIVIEACTMALTTIWFAGGALAAFFAALLGLSIRFQLTLFLLISFLLLVFTRPILIKFTGKNTEKTNADSLIGKKAKVLNRIDNSLAEGTAVLNGQEWTARALDDNQVIPAGEIVIVREIRGVKLIVERVMKEEK